MISTKKKRTNRKPDQKTYCVTNCRYNCGFGIPGGVDRSLGDISKKTVKHVLLSRPHIFHEVVFPCPITVSAQRGPFCMDVSSHIASDGFFASKDTKKQKTEGKNDDAQDICNMIPNNKGVDVA